MKKIIIRDNISNNHLFFNTNKNKSKIQFFDHKFNIIKT